MVVSGPASEGCESLCDVGPTPSGDDHSPGGHGPTFSNGPWTNTRNDARILPVQVAFEQLTFGHDGNWEKKVTQKVSQHPGPMHYRVKGGIYPWAEYRDSTPR